MVTIVHMASHGIIQLEYLETSNKKLFFCNSFSYMLLTALHSARYPLCKLETSCQISALNWLHGLYEIYTCIGSVHSVMFNYCCIIVTIFLIILKGIWHFYFALDSINYATNSNYTSSHRPWITLFLFQHLYPGSNGWMTTMMQS